MRTKSCPHMLLFLSVHCSLGKYVERLRGADKKIETFPCPTCRSEFMLKSNQDAAELPSSYFIMNMLKIMEIQQKAKESPTCAHCREPAIRHCASCEMFMCTKCSESHDLWPANKKHDVISVQELSNPESPVKSKRKLFCTKHEEKILEFYCETCKELCCIHCLVLNHQKQNHSCVAVSDVAKKQKVAMQSSCTTLNGKVSEAKQAIKNISEVMKSLEKNAKMAKDQIKQHKDNILKIMSDELDKKEKEMSEEVDKIYGEMHKELSEQHDEIKDYLDKVQASVSLPNNLLKRGSIEEIMSLQKLIDENINKLTNEQPEDLSAVNDGVIDYVPGDIGNINVDQFVGKLGCVKGMYSVFSK